MSNSLERLERIGDLMERLVRWQVAIIVLTGGAVLWGARLEWAAGDHEKRLSRVEGFSDELRMDVKGIKTSLHGVASQIGEVPGAVAAKIIEVEEEQQ